MKYRLIGTCAAAFCCAVPVFAQGLSRVELLGLQQQLRDDGCGVTHVTGRMDAMTRSAVKKCESKYPGATDARSMLGAMHIGFENGNQDPTMATAHSGSGGSMSAGGTTGTMMDSTARMRRGMNRMRNDSTGRHMRGMMRDSAGRGMMQRRGMRDSTMRMRGRDTTHSQGMGGMVDSNKSTPMAPAAKNPVSPMTNPRNSSTMSPDSPSMKPDTAKHDTMPKPI